MMKYFCLDDSMRFRVTEEIDRLRQAATGGRVRWEVVREEGGYRLEVNRSAGAARLIDRQGHRVATGSETSMDGRMDALIYLNRGDSDGEELMREIAALSREPVAELGPEEELLKAGDIIGIRRSMGYEHYAVYVGGDRVIHYADDRGDIGPDIVIHEADMSEFLLGQKRFFVLDFPDSYGVPQKLYRGDGCEPEHPVVIEKLLGSMKAAEYRLYSPEETVARARSRLGENRYDLAFNNCEHFAIWCKTGLHESFQSESVMDIVGSLFRIPLGIG